MEQTNGNKSDKDRIPSGKDSGKVKLRSHSTSAKRQSHEQSSARKPFDGQLSARQQSNCFSARKKFSSPQGFEELGAQNQCQAQISSASSYRARTTESYPGNLGIAPAKSQKSTPRSSITKEKGAVKVHENVEGCAIIAKAFDTPGMNGHYSETGETFSGRPVFSNGKFKLYQTNLSGQSSASKADRWHLESVESGRSHGRVLGYACLPSMNSDIEHLSWWCLVDGAWKPCNGRFQRKRKPVAPMPQSARSPTPDGSSVMHKAYERMTVEGFTVYVESCVQAEERSGVLEQLKGDLKEVVRIVTPPRVEVLRHCAIWVSATSPVKTEEAHGMNFVARAKSIEISNIPNYLEWHSVRPSMLPHELASFLYLHLRTTEEKENGRSVGGVVEPIDDGSGRMRASGFSLLWTRGINGVFTPTGETSGGKPVYISSDDRDVYRLYFTRKVSGQNNFSVTDSWVLEHTSREQLVAYSCSSRLLQATWKSFPGSFAHKAICSANEEAMQKGLYSRDDEQHQLLFQKPAKYFANASGAFLSSSRFHNLKFPCVHSELRGFDLAGYRMCETIWDVKGEAMPSRAEFPCKWLAKLSGHMAIDTCRANFNEADKDKDGVIMPQEFLQIVRCLVPGITLPCNSDDNALRFADIDHKGTITWWGCLAWLAVRQTTPPCVTWPIFDNKVVRGKPCDTGGDSGMLWGDDADLACFGYSGTDVKIGSETETTSALTSPLQSPSSLTSGLLPDCTPALQQYPFHAGPRTVNKLPPLPKSSTPRQKTRPNYQALFQPKALRSVESPEQLE